MNRSFGLLPLAVCPAVLLCGCKSKQELKSLNSVMLSAVTEPAVFKVLNLAEFGVGWSDDMRIGQEDAVRSHGKAASRGEVLA
ncbi:MAG TPA: hypothetical protein VGV35_02945 [Bryobacteraceae bacterium]|nr:hypothetical protein [Bryobacteraceae bacterium]